MKLNNTSTEAYMLLKRPIRLLKTKENVKEKTDYALSIPTSHRCVFILI